MLCLLGYEYLHHADCDDDLTDTHLCQPKYIQLNKLYVIRDFYTAVQKINTNQT